MCSQGDNAAANAAIPQAAIPQAAPSSETTTSGLFDGLLGGQGNTAGDGVEDELDDLLKAYETVSGGGPCVAVGDRV